MRKASLLFTAGVCAQLCSPAIAQTTPDTTTARAGQADAASPGEIVVTAQRRSEKLKDVPIAITALTGASLEIAGITSAQNLGEVTPGLNYAVQGAFAEPTIRGIGTSVTGAGADANVSIYVDGVYQPSQTANLFDFNNIERIEVLKGPQGTLFGRNATGGAIRVITTDPNDVRSGQFGLSYGRFNEVKVDGYYNTPLADGLSANIAFLAQHNTGYIDNVTRNEEVGRAYSYAARGKIKYEASDKVSFILAGNYSRTDDNSPFAVRPIDGNNTARQLGAVFPPGFYQVALDTDPIIKTVQYGTSLTARAEVASGVLTSITSYQRIRPRLLSDIDNSPLFLSNATIPSKERNFTQEVNYASAFSGPFNFVSGIYYYHDKTNTNLILTTGVPTPHTVVTILTRVVTDAISGYTEANYKLTDSLQLTGGIRYSSEKKDALAGLPGLTIVDASKRWNSWTPRAVARYTLDPYSNVYASYSRGFKSGNYNVAALSPIPVKPEAVDAYEIGYKRSEHGFSVNVSAFYYNYRDIQVQIQTNNHGILSTFLQNAATARIYGGDIDFTLPITQSFKLQGGAAYTHARYRDFVGAIITTPLTDVNGVPIGGNSQAPGDASGNELIRTPTFTANLTGIYSFDVGGGRLDLSSTGSYNSGFYWDPANNVKQHAYFLLNARASWLSPNKHYRLSVFGDNLTSQHYYFYVNSTQTGNGGAPAKPWSAGGSVDFYF